MEESLAASPGRAWRRFGLLAIGFLLLPLALCLPVDGGRHADLNPQQLKLGLGVFACIGFLWLSEALPLAATALLVPVLAVLTGLGELKTALTSFADPLIFLFFGGFALAAAMTRQGLDRWIADWIVGVGRGDFLKVSYLIFAATAGLSMWMSNTATTALILPLVLGILRAMPNGTPGHAVFLLLGTAYAASIGGLGTLVGTPPNGIAAAKLQLGFVGWLRYGLPSMLLLLPLMVGVLRVMCRPSRLTLALPERTGFEWTRPRLGTLAIFALTGLAWIAGGSLGGLLKIGNSFDTLVALIAVLALMIFRIVSWQDIERNTEWGVLLLFGGGMALSAILDRTGASLFMAREIVHVVDGWPVILVIAVSLLFVILLGEFSSNTATAALMVPIFYSVGKELGVAPAKLVIPIAIAASCGFMLPVATPPNALVFATGRIPQREMIRTGLVLDLVSLVAVSLLAWWVF